MNLRDKIQQTVSHDLSDEFLVGLFCDGVSEITDGYSSPEYISSLFVIGDVIRVLKQDKNTLDGTPDTPDQTVEGGGRISRYSVCEKISLTEYYDAGNSTSLKYRGEGNPGYTIVSGGGIFQQGGEYGLGQIGSQRGLVLVVPDPRLLGSVIKVEQIIYNLSDFFRELPVESTATFTTFLDSPSFNVKIESEDVYSMLYEFPSRYQHMLFTYVIVQILNISILNAGNSEEDEELVKTLKEAKEDYQTQYDNFYSYIGSKSSEGAAKDES